MSSLATIRTRVRQDLMDEDSAAYRWTDAQLQRHIERALREYSNVSPLEDKDTLVTVAGSREISIASLTPRVRVVQVEWPTGAYPPNTVPFSAWADTLTLDVTNAPAGVENVNVWWQKEHTINGTTTFPAAHDDVIATGAAGYAAEAWSSFATNRLTVSDDVWGKYKDSASDILKRFREMLRALPAANAVRTAQMYTPSQGRQTSQTTDPGPV